MSTLEKLAGTWTADLEKWGELDPRVAELGDMADMVFGNLKVELSASNLVIDSGKGRPKEYALNVREESGSKVVIDVVRKDEPGVFEISATDDDHMVLRLTEPKEDVMALKRA